MSGEFRRRTRREFHPEVAHNRRDLNEKLSFLKIHDDAFWFLRKVKYWGGTRDTLNPALRFNKFLAFDRKQGKFDYTKTISSSGIERFSMPEDISRRIEIITQEKNYDPSRFCVRGWELKTQWRMVIGLGSPHVHETAMTWHHTWSVPYIPGSALKGVARSYYLGRLWERFSEHFPNESWEESTCCLEAWIMDEAHPSRKEVGHTEEDCPVIRWIGSVRDEMEKEKKRFQAIFGTQKRKGAVKFMDAYPVDRFCLKLDVMNVHYPEYYRGEKEYAADWESPNPVFFLTVVDTRFRGILLVDKRQLKKSEFTLTSDGLLEKVKSTLIEALESHGIGAKTSVGYGILL